MSVLAAILLALAVVATQVLHGGLLEAAFTVPAYALLEAAAAAAFVSVWRRSVPASLLGAGAVLAFVGYVAWRALHSPDAYFGRRELQLALGGGLAFFVAGMGLRNNRARLVFVGVVGVAALAQAVIGILQFTRGEPTAPCGWFSETLKSIYEDRFTNRAHGFFLNPNQFAWLMTWSALFSVALAAWSRVGVIWRIVLVYFSLVFVAADVLSSSRGGMVSLLAGLVVFTLLSVIAVVSGRRRGRLGMVLGAVTLLLLCVGVGGGVYLSNWVTQGRVDATFSVADDRVILAENAWRQFQSAPLLGQGAGMFTYAARKYRTGGQEGDPVFAHDDWLQMLADYGAVGFGLALIAFLLLFGGGIQRLFAVVTQNARVDDRLASNSVAILGGTLAVAAAFFVHSFTDFNLHVPANTLLAGATLGFLTGTMGSSAMRNFVRRLQEALARMFAGLGLAALAVSTGWLLWKNALPDYESLQAQNFLQNGQVVPALAAIERGLRQSPDNAALLLAQGQAKYEYLSAMDSGDSPERAQLTPLKLRKLFEDSAAAYVQALRQQPLERLTEISLARSLVELHREAEAKQHLVQAIGLDPWQTMPYLNYAENLHDAGDIPRAIRILELGLTLPGWEDAAGRLQDIREELAPAADEAESEDDKAPGDASPEKP